MMNRFTQTARKVWFPLRNPLYTFRNLYVYLQIHRFRHRSMIALPHVVKLNTGYKCNLQCPLCPTGRRNPRIADDLTLETVNALYPHMERISMVCLYGWGEAFLNKEIFEIIAFFQQRRKLIAMDSNLCFRNQDLVNQIADCPIDVLSVSLDGCDQESYQRYRKSGSFDLVIENLKTLMKSPRRPKRIIWQYLIHRHNIQQVSSARQIADTLGIEFRTMDLGLYIDALFHNSPTLQDEWWTDDQKSRAQIRNRFPSRTCMWLYCEPFIDTDGKVYPCCMAPHASRSLLNRGYVNAFGDLHTQSLEEILNNELYSYMREQFVRRTLPEPETKPICLKCKAYLPSEEHCGLPHFPFEECREHDPEITGRKPPSVEEIAS